MKWMRLSACLAIVAATASGAMLFTTSQKTQEAESRHYRLQAERLKERETIRVLRAEWDYLNRPDRLETLAGEYLGMQRPDVAAILHDVAVLPEHVPPVLPGRKPDFTPREAAYSAPVSPPVSSASSPSFSPSSPEPVTAPPQADESRRDSQQSFHQLIEKLSQSGEADR